jgi:hypothetical protein
LNDSATEIDHAVGRALHSCGEVIQVGIETQA